MPFGGNTFLKFDIYLFTKPSNDFEKWLTYPEWMMIGAASPNVIELTLVRSWSKVSIFMCRLASPHEVIWKWTNLRVSSFCEIIKQNLWSLTLCTEWIDIKQSCYCMYCNWVEPMKNKKKLYYCFEERQCWVINSKF